MATAEAPNPPPLKIIEEHGLVEIYLHCDFELSEAQFATITSKLQAASLPRIENRRRQLRWATPGDDGGFWEFRVELYALSRDTDSPSLHLMVIGDKVGTEPTPYRRSRRTVERIRSLVDALFAETLTAELDCSMTWHTSSDSWPLPRVLP